MQPPEKIWKILGSREKRRWGEFRVQENPFLIKEAAKPPPNIAKFFQNFSWPFRAIPKT
ncbi:MAG TPA: hypothetical protein VKU03_11415 [Roseiarcus sp.]|nr:hypothetical protein [Roseiarcus sp.]